MPKKQPRKIAKITHVKLSKKDGQKFDFTNPFGDSLGAEKNLVAPKIDSGLGNTYIDIPEFLQFKSTATQSTQSDQLLLETGEGEEKVVELEDASIPAPKQKEGIFSKIKREKKKEGSFDAYFASNNLFDLYRKKAAVKSIVLGALSTVLLCTLLFAGTWFSWATLPVLLVLGIAYTLVTALFYIMSVDSFAVHVTILLQGLIVMFISALFGMFNVASVVIILFFIALLTIAFKETERQQIINRLFDIFYITRPATRLLHIAMISVLGLTIANYYSTHKPESFYQRLVSTSWVQNIMDQGDSGQAAGLARELIGSHSYNDFVTTFPSSTVKDFLIQTEYSGDSTKVLPSNELSIITRDPLLTQEEKDAKILAKSNQALTQRLLEKYETTADLDGVLNAGNYYGLLKQSLIHAVTDVNTGLPKSVGLVPLFGQTFPAIVIGFVSILLYQLGWWLYRFISVILNFFGISVEKIVWWALKKSKLVQISKEKLESEVIVV